MDIPILFQDARFAVLNKPPGLPVHPGPRGGASVEDCFPLLSRRRDGPWLAHRLDADTAGCLVVALRRAALHAAQAAFAGRQADKRYWAVVQGRPPQARGSITLGLRKHSDRNGWQMRPDPDGPPAITEWEIQGEADGLCWLAVRPRTGRTHQIRAHLASLGCPILGDPVYGAPTARHRLHLLARSIALPLDPPLQAQAAPPAHMVPALQACGYGPDLPSSRP